MSVFLLIADRTVLKTHNCCCSFHIELWAERVILYILYLQLLLITSKHFNSERNWWIVPGGSIEADEDPMIAAEREVYEESGVKGRILRSIGQVLVSDYIFIYKELFVMSSQAGF